MPFLSIVLFILATLYSTSATTNITNIHIINHCPYTLWAAVQPGGGKRLDPNQNWTVGVISGGSPGRVWARTNCQFNQTGHGRCESGDCGGLLECQAWGQAPNTLAEFAINPFSNLDFFDMSLIDGFNVPMEFGPLNSSGCSFDMIRCTDEINGLCPTELRDPGGCHNPCTLFGNDQFCCNGGVGVCEPTVYSKFFKELCPNVYTYPKDDATSAFTCPTGTHYKVVFCP